MKAQPHPDPGADRIPALGRWRSAGLAFGTSFTRLTSNAAALLYVVLWAAQSTAAPSNSLSEDALMEIRFDQKLDAQLPLDLRFRDEHGARLELGDALDGKPVILVLGYYECPMLCSLVLNGLVKGMQELKLEVGRDFDVIMISIDPQETPALAAAKKRTYLKRYGRTRDPSGWHFLTGDESEIGLVTGATGFHYAYDAGLAQYAHPSGLIVLTPHGKVSRYLFGVDYPAKDLDAALREAGSNRIGSPIRQFILLCFHYQPLTGKYGDLIMGAVRASGIVTILAVAGIIAMLGRRRRALSARATQCGASPAADHPREEGP